MAERTAGQRQLDAAKEILTTLTMHVCTENCKTCRRGAEIIAKHASQAEAAPTPPFDDLAAHFCLKHNCRTINCTPRTEELIGMLKGAYDAGLREAAGTPTQPDKPTLEADLLDEVIKTLAQELSCGPNVYEIREAISKLLAGQKDRELSERIIGRKVLDALRASPSHAPTAPKCPRCGVGFDTNGDGDCGYCHALTDEALKEFQGVARASAPPTKNYRGGDCEKCGRARIELDGVCEKCTWDNDNHGWASVTRDMGSAPPTCPDCGSYSYDDHWCLTHHCTPYNCTGMLGCAICVDPWHSQPSAEGGKEGK